MRRCFLCAADMLGPSRRHLTYPDGRARVFPIACGSCGILLDADADPGRCRAHLAERLAGASHRPDPDAPYGLDLYTLRSAATGFGLGIRAESLADRADLAHPHATRAGAADLYTLATAAGPSVSLGVLCRPAELNGVLTVLAGHAAWSDDVVILLDDATRPPEPVAAEGFPLGAVRVGARPLEGDFAGQRNALQALASHPWMLQLDADETLAPACGRLLPALAALAEAGDVVSIGLARRNHVDGILSDVYPDVQYRLNRSSVRYEGRVHERPVLAGGWPRSLIALHGTLEHHLRRAHVLARSRRYEVLAPGQGRVEEEVALLRPYRA